MREVCKTEHHLQAAERLRLQSRVFASVKQVSSTKSESWNLFGSEIQGQCSSRSYLINYKVKKRLGRPEINFTILSSGGLSGKDPAPGGLRETSFLSRNIQALGLFS